MAPRDTHADIIWLEEADSTNSELRRRLEDCDNLSIISARSQTAGRGQGTHTWYSSPRTNLTFSVLYRYGLPSDAAAEGASTNAEGEPLMKATDALLITCVTTLALRDYLLERGITARIKWHNDIWVGDKKICGILIENILDGAYVHESIVGIGLDVNETGWPDYLPNPVSMKELTGKEYDLDAELVVLQEKIRHRFGQLASSDGRDSLLKEFEKYMFKLTA